MSLKEVCFEVEEPSESSIIGFRQARGLEAEVIWGIRKYNLVKDFPNSKLEIIRQPLNKYLFGDDGSRHLESIEKYLQRAPPIRKRPTDLLSIQHYFIE